MRRMPFETEMPTTITTPVSAAMEVVALDGDRTERAAHVAVGAECDGAAVFADADGNPGERVGIVHRLPIVGRDHVVGLTIRPIDPDAWGVDVPQGRLEGGLGG